MALIFLLGLFIISSQVAGEYVYKSNLNPFEKSFFEQLEEWIKNIFNELKELIEKIVEKLKEFWNSLFIQNQLELDQEFHHFKNELLTSLSEYPDVCTKGVNDKLLSFKEESDKDFFNCANLTIAAKDVGKILFEAGKLSAAVLIAADDVINGLRPCVTWKIWITVPCIITWTKTTVSDFFNLFKEIGGFGGKVNSLIDDIKKQIAYCKGDRQIALSNALIKVQKNLLQCDMQNK